LEAAAGPGACAHHRWASLCARRAWVRPLSLFLVRCPPPNLGVCGSCKRTKTHHPLPHAEAFTWCWTCSRNISLATAPSVHTFFTRACARRMRTAHAEGHCMCAIVRACMHTQAPRRHHLLKFQPWQFLACHQLVQSAHLSSPGFWGSMLKISQVEWANKGSPQCLVCVACEPNGIPQATDAQLPGTFG
jgi:hypothetical protein